MRVLQNPDEAARFAASVVRRHLPDPAYRIFLFGSRAAGTTHPRSDIDIGIEGPAPVPRAVLAAIDDEMKEAPTLYTIEIVDFARVSDRFRLVEGTSAIMKKRDALRTDLTRAIIRLEEALALSKDSHSHYRKIQSCATRRSSGSRFHSNCAGNT